MHNDDLGEFDDGGFLLLVAFMLALVACVVLEDGLPLLAQSLLVVDRVDEALHGVLRLVVAFLADSLILNNNLEGVLKPLLELLLCPLIRQLLDLLVDRLDQIVEIVLGVLLVVIVPEVLRTHSLDIIDVDTLRLVLQVLEQPVQLVKQGQSNLVPTISFRAVKIGVCGYDRRESFGHEEGLHYCDDIAVDVLIDYP